MGRLKYKKWSAFCLTGLLTFGMTTPVFAKTVVATAAEENIDGPMTLEEIQKQVLKSNRLKTTLNLNYKKVLSGLDAIDEGLSDLKDTQDSAARARKQAGDAASAGKDLVNAIPPSYDPDYVLGQVSSGLLSGSYKTANAMEDMTDSIVDQKRDELENQQQSLKNTKQDLNKTQEDWNNQALLVSQLLVVKTAQVEKAIGLLEEKQDLMERLYTIEEKKESLGLSIKTDLKQAKLSVSENSKDVQDAKDGLTLLKRQINDLMGKPIDEKLEIVAPEMTRVIEYAPEYSDELLKEAKDKNYQLKTLRRDYQQAQEKTKDNTLYSGQIKAHQLDMDIAKVSMENQEIAIANDLKKKLDSINKAASAYQIQKDTYEKAKIQLEQQQKTAEVGMLSSVEIQALELQFKQNELALMAAAYDYDLAWEEYRLLMSGTSLDIYDTYKAQVGA